MSKLENSKNNILRKYIYINLFFVVILLTVTAVVATYHFSRREDQSVALDQVYTPLKDVNDDKLIDDNEVYKPTYQNLNQDIIEVNEKTMLSKEDGYLIAVLHKYALGMKYKTPLLQENPENPNNLVQYIGPTFEGDEETGLKMQYAGQGNEKFEFRYYCFADDSQNAVFADSPRISWSQYYKEVMETDKNLYKISVDPFFTPISRRDIKEVYLQENPDGNSNQRAYYFTFSSTQNYCKMTLTHINGDDLNRAEKFLADRVDLQLDNVAPSEISAGFFVRPERK
jgi:hypothetical protein